MQLIGMIPSDDELSKANHRGESLFELDEKSPAVKAVETIAEKLGLLSEVTLLKLLGKDS
jgi:Flp pilus assembly CpaE family ATPase